MLKPLFAATALIAAVLAAPAQASPPEPEDRGASEAARQRHQETVDFWTAERVRQAVPRDFVLDPATGRFQGPEDRAKGAGRGKPGDGGDGGGTGDATTAITGASWETGGAPAEATGKVLFRMGGSYFVCSATALEDNVAGTTMVVTAGHCVFDNDADAKEFADMWMFVPNYDAAPAPLDADGNFCESTQYGCWTPEALVVSKGFAAPDGFTSAAIPYDVAFARLGLGGNSGELLELEAALPVGPDGIDLPVPVFAHQPAATQLSAFGYPSAKKYPGSDLVYCQGPIGFDGRQADATYRMDCSMTGGSSGGGWWTSTTSDETVTAGITSVNSYGYRGDSSMYGPKLGDEAEKLFDKGLQPGVTGGTEVELG